jgi:hypothetical protein
MRGKLMFVVGAGVGYVLGTRAGRERFDQIVAQARRFWESNSVQEAAGVVQSRAGRLYDDGKHMMADQAQKMRHRKEFRRDKDQTDANQHAWDASVGFPAT